MKLKIGHLADIHVRGLSRHDEVRTVISAFCYDAIARGVNHIVIAGDIWHTKVTGMSPESINLLTWMFRSLADVCTVHVTLGNHDGVLTNFTRQDAISPIIDAISDSRIKLYKKSGVYPIESGVNLCVYSLFDQENWEFVKPISEEYNIAVFHGSVAGAESETGWALKADVSVKWFDDLGYDLVLLGDIHKRQFLGYREI
jgi:DNA repair exonuclease SbcCD nuclease subunit